MDSFLAHIQLILPTLGFDLFKSEAALSSRSSDISPDPTFTFETAGASATARETDEGFVVLAGSTARVSMTETFPAGYRALRDQLLADELLRADSSPRLLRFTADVSFSSPSAAAAIVAGRSASGPREWRLKATGQAYREWIADPRASKHLTLRPDTS